VSRLASQDPELARRFAASEPSTRMRAARATLDAALRMFEPPLELPSDPVGLAELVEANDFSEDLDRWRRARAASAAQFLAAGDASEALYEAIHAAPSPKVAMSLAASLL
jgi:hypothetical protein